MKNINACVQYLIFVNGRQVVWLRPTDVTPEYSARVKTLAALLPGDVAIRFDCLLGSMWL